jgi:hypothetical protein
MDAFIGVFGFRLLGSGFVVRQRSQAAGNVMGFGLRTGFDASRPLPAALAVRLLVGAHDTPTGARAVPARSTSLGRGGLEHS